MSCDRLSWLRFLGFTLRDWTPDENAICLLRNRMAQIGAPVWVMKIFDCYLRKRAIFPSEFK